MAKFIVIDGLDGCGKATQTELLKQELESLGKRVIKIDFPKYESDSSMAVRMYLGGKLGSDPEKINPYMCGTFYAVDRFIQYLMELHKYFEEDDNTIIISDRYLSANIIHQGGKIESRAERLQYIKWCYDYECNLCGLPKEDITIILTVSPVVSQRLMTKRYKGHEEKKDIHEANLEYLNKCHTRLMETIEDIGYNNIARWKHIDCTESKLVNNGEDLDTYIKSKEIIHELIMNIVNDVITSK